MKVLWTIIKWIGIWFGCSVVYEMMRQYDEQKETI